MQGLINYVKEFWVIIVLLLLAIIAFLFVLSKTSKSLAKTRKEKEALMKKLDHMKKIREEYSNLTEEKILSDESVDLLEGVTDNIQQRLEKDDNMAEAFEKLNEEEKLAYAFFYLVDEGKEKMSQFFKTYTKPLTPYALKACKDFCEKDLYSLIKEEYDSYDDDNEEASIIKEETDKCDEKIKLIFDENNLKTKACEYIKKNSQKFV